MNQKKFDIFPNNDKNNQKIRNQNRAYVMKTCIGTAVLEKTLESLLDCKEINSKGNQPGIFIRRTDAKAPILWPSDANSRLIGKDPDAGKD